MPRDPPATTSPKLRRVTPPRTPAREPATLPSARAVCSMPELTRRVATAPPARTPPDDRTGSGEIRLTTPPSASLPYCTEPDPLRTSMRSRLNASMVFMYWFGPSRNVALFSRMPSMRTRTWLPTRPRTMGDPPPWLVFCTHPPLRSCRASGDVRSARSSRAVLVTTAVDRGTSEAARSARAAVTTTDSSTRSSTGASATWRTASAPAMSIDARTGRNPGAETRATAAPAGRLESRAMPPTSVTAPASRPSMSTRAPPIGAPEAADRTSTLRAPAARASVPAPDASWLQRHATAMISGRISLSRRRARGRSGSRRDGRAPATLLSPSRVSGSPPRDARQPVRPGVRRAGA